MKFMQNIKNKLRVGLSLIFGFLATAVLAGENAQYLIIDLSGGTKATSYPVTTRTGVPDGGWTDEYKSTKLVLRRCPAGADPLGRYTLTKDFYAGVFEVTERQWELVMGSNPSLKKRGDTYPVENVSYNDIRGTGDGAKWPSSSAVDATSFLGKLRAKTGLTELDLPTEAQWEYACRAGTTTTYNTGDSESALAQAGWYSGNSNEQKHPVGENVANEWGLYDMHGNVWEWCLDWYQWDAPSGTDPIGAASSSGRNRRGGSWNYGADYAASSYRSLSSPWFRHYYSGFRLFMPAEQRVVCHYNTVYGVVGQELRKPNGDHYFDVDWFDYDTAPGKLPDDVDPQQTTMSVSPSSASSWLNMSAYKKNLKETPTDSQSWYIDGPYHPFVCTPTEAGTFDMKRTFTWSDGHTESVTVKFVIASAPTIVGDDGANVTIDDENGYVITPSAGKEAVEVTIPSGVDAAKVTVKVSPETKKVTPNGAAVKVVRGEADITDFLDIPAAVGGVIDLDAATVKEEIVKDVMDTTRNEDPAEIKFDATSPSIKTAPTKPGLTYRLKEGATLEAMKANTTGDSKVGDGKVWTPNIMQKGGTSGFYTIEVTK